MVHIDFVAAHSVSQVRELVSHILIPKYDVPGFLKKCGLEVLSVVSNQMIFATYYGIAS